MKLCLLPNRDDEENSGESIKSMLISWNLKKNYGLVIVLVPCNCFTKQHLLIATQTFQVIALFRSAFLKMKVNITVASLAILIIIIACLVLKGESLAGLAKLGRRAQVECNQQSYNRNTLDSYKGLIG